MRTLSSVVRAGAWLAFGLAPAAASAHEVYVLPSDVAVRALAAPAFSEWQVMLDHFDQFMFWGFIAALVIFAVFFISISRFAERLLDPVLAKLPPYAPAIGRITIGISFLAAAYYGALFGPELPLDPVFGALGPGIRVVLALIGVCAIIGYRTRLAALAGLALFAVEAHAHGSYMLTYANYFGELAVLLVLGAHSAAVHGKDRDRRRAPSWLLKTKAALAPLAFPFLRIAFGTALIYASLYAKVFHNGLALAVAAAYPTMVAFFGFEPHFLILGAAIIEILIGAFFVLGIEIRFTSLFLLFWLSLSLWYFGEVVWPHIILIGIPVAFIFYGYDAYSLEGRFFKKDGREPVL